MANTRTNLAAIIRQLSELGLLEGNAIAGMFPTYLGDRTRALASLSPGANQARYDAYRNNALSTAAQRGKYIAALLGLQGAGSGAQESAINSALLEGANDANNYNRYMLSPEFILSQIGAQQSLLNPLFGQTALGMLREFKSTKQPKEKKPGVLGGLLGTAAQLYGMGAFGGVPDVRRYLTGPGLGQGLGYLASGF